MKEWVRQVSNKRSKTKKITERVATVGMWNTRVRLLLGVGSRVKSNMDGRRLMPIRKSKKAEVKGTISFINHSSLPIGRDVLMQWRGDARYEVLVVWVLISHFFGAKREGVYKSIA